MIMKRWFNRLTQVYLTLSMLSGVAAVGPFYFPSYENVLVQWTVFFSRLAFTVGVVLFSMPVFLA